jgi:surface polysaccharide O-acyltransferase-like enzyme
MENKAHRIIWLDLLRVIAVFCMMVLHVCASQFDELTVTSSSWQTLNMYDSIVRSCVPVFVMISGVFFLDPDRDYPLGKLFKNHILRIVTAYIFWSFCYAVLVSYNDLRSFGAPFIVSVVENTITGRYHLWFLNMIVAIYLVVPFLRVIARDRKLLRYYIILAFAVTSVCGILTNLPIAGALLDTVLEKSSLYMVAGYTGYFMAGYYIFTCENVKKYKHFLYAAAIIAVMVTIAGTSALSVHDGSANRLLYNYLYPTTALEAVGIFTFFKEEVGKCKFAGKVGNVIVRLSEMSFGMYLVHDFVNIALKLIRITTTSFATVAAVPVMAILVFAISAVIISVLRLIPVARKYIM